MTEKYNQPDTRMEKLADEACGQLAGFYEKLTSIANSLERIADKMDTLMIQEDLEN